METMNYNYPDILHKIKSGKLTALYIIIADRWEDDERDPELIDDTTIHFAGTTADECKKVLNNLERLLTSDIYEYITLTPMLLSVNPDDLDDEDDEDDAEDIINDYTHNNWQDAESIENVNSVIVNTNNYDSMQHGILLYWTWEKHIGYARRVLRMEYCLDSCTTLRCKPIDKCFTPQCTLLVSPQEMQELKNARNLRNLIQQRIDDMDRWNSSIDVDNLLCDIYYYAQRNSSLYQLPNNNLYNFD